MTAPSDQYALACVAYALLSGDLPFIGTRDEIDEAHLRRPVPPITDGIGMELPDALNACFERALAKEAEERFDSCRDFHARVLPYWQGRSATGPSRGPSRESAIALRE